jgi:hypothetical protein
MRTCLAFFSVLLIPLSSFAQIDPGAQAAQAAQQAAQQSQQAMQQAIQQSQQAATQAQQAMQNAQDDPPAPWACCGAWTAPPKFSVKAGRYSGSTTVKITDSTRAAVIYYSTDGWTPTTNSPRYRGPITIDSTTTLQAIAIAPYSMRSIVTSAQYTIIGSPTNSSAAPPSSSFPASPASGASNLIPVPLVFEADVNSKSAEVGDKIPMTLSEDVKIGDFVVPKGTPATVTITQDVHTGIGGAPGSISFEVDELHPPSGPIPLQGGATREGEAKPPNASVIIPVVGPLSTLRHGDDAVIPKGTPFIAYFDMNLATANAH